MLGLENLYLSKCRRRCEIAETLAERNFDLAFQVIHEFNLPGTSHRLILPFFFRIFQDKYLNLSLIYAQLFQLLIYMLVLLHHLLRERGEANSRSSLGTLKAPSMMMIGIRYSCECNGLQCVFLSVQRQMIDLPFPFSFF